MPPLPSGAPTTGNAALIYWSLLGTTAVLFVVFGALKFFYPSGKDRLDRKNKDESEAILILREQIAEMRKVQNDLGEEIEEVRRVRAVEMQTGIRLNDKVQTLLLWCESYYDLIQEMKAEWTDMPPHFATRLERMKKPSEVLKRFD